MSMADSHTFARPFGATVCICRDYAVRVFGKLLKQASWIGADDKLEDTAAAFAWLQPSFLVVHLMSTDWVRLLYYKRNEMSSTIALMAGRRSADDV